MRELKNLINREQLESACLENAENLLKESGRMLKRKKYELATFLSITALEETQKLHLMSFFDSHYINEVTFEKYWIDHITKYRIPKSRIRVVIDDNDISKSKLKLGKKSEAKKIFNNRNKCLYADFYKNKIESPADIGATIAVDYYNMANEELKSASMFYKLAKDVIKHLGY